MQIFLRKWIIASNISFGNEAKHLTTEKTGYGMAVSRKSERNKSGLGRPGLGKSIEERQVKKGQSYRLRSSAGSPALWSIPKISRVQTEPW